jgi:hypothetical protein
VDPLLGLVQQTLLPLPPVAIRLLKEQIVLAGNSEYTIS